MIRCAINGRFLTQPITGVQRYAFEVVSALDDLLTSQSDLRSGYSFEVLTPQSGRMDTHWRHIPVRKVGAYSGHLWEQLELPRHLQGRLLIGLANTGPIGIRRQIVTIHDASVSAAPAGYSQAFRLWYRILMRILGKTARGVVTDSCFSRDELHRWFGIPMEKVAVIPLGGDHVLRVASDSAVFDGREWASRPFVLAAGSLNPNKNLGALLETAVRLNESGISLIIAGGANQRVFSTAKWTFTPNVHCLGYVSDAALRALYERALCLVFPSKYEGFGLPPIEAMACGCPVVASNAASLPEVCGNAARYVDPHSPGDIADRVMEVVTSATVQNDLRRLGRERAGSYQWVQSARQWLALIEANR
ncbi:MAG: glycosyltransferase family 4 protein [candidate division Zixibacteria bacterium]|nr:glycosyltransferase family 4 protein [candidate division Zixibacteria bacterium]